jgi:hypothetical protein
MNSEEKMKKLVQYMILALSLVGMTLAVNIWASVALFWLVVYLELRFHTLEVDMKMVRKFIKW